MSIEELEIERAALEEEMNNSRNSAVKAECKEKIKNINIQINELQNESLEHEVKIQKEVPVRADHKKSKSISRGQVINGGSSMVDII